MSQSGSFGAGLSTPVSVANGGTGDSTLTAHSVLLGEGTSAVAFAGPGATSGVALISQGASADPTFGTVVVAGGGTGVATLTAHSVLLGEGTSTVAFAGPSSTSGVPLISQGSSSDPIFSANVNVARPIVSVSGTTKTFALSDANTFQQCSNGSTQTLTVDTNANVAFPTGTEIDVWQQGAGQVVFAAAGGVTIQSAFSNLKVATQYTGASLKYLGSDTWALVGNLTA